MRTLTKTLLAAGTLAVASSASAAFVEINVHEDAFDQQEAFLNNLDYVAGTENFDALGGNQVIGDNARSSWENSDSSFSTEVGTFALKEPGNGLNDHSDELRIQSDETGGFGRTSVSGNGYWLDSNDAKQVVWNFDSSSSGYTNALGFYLSDVADVAGELEMILSDADGNQLASQTIQYPQVLGNLKYVTVYSDTNLFGGSLTFNNSSMNDGWGIDGITVGEVPEPGTLLLMGLGLLGLGVARRRISKQ